MIFMQVELPGVEKLSVVEKRKERKFIFNLHSHVHQFLIGFILSNSLADPFSEETTVQFSPIVDGGWAVTGN